MNKFFNPANLPPTSQNPSNLGGNFASPNPSASYPPRTGPYSYPPQATPYYHMPTFLQDQASDLHHQRSISFPTPPLQPPSRNPNAGARLMAMLNNPHPNLDHSRQPTTSLPPIQPSSGEFSSQPMHAVHAASSPMRMPSSKLPSGRHLAGDHVVYDVDVRMPGEEQPQLEVTPITKYGSDPCLVLGHQIAVNKTYICYGLKLGAIRVLNINTALRALFRGHTQRVTDMAFFAENVPLLASASIDGRVYAWKISEGPDEEEKPQISGNIMLAIQISGAEGSIHPRICWHCHKQEILVVAVGKSVLRIDSTKVGKGVDFVAEEPLQCPMDKLIDGIQLVGMHEGEVTDLSMCQWMTTRLVSASKDGTGRTGHASFNNMVERLRVCLTESGDESLAEKCNAVISSTNATNKNKGYSGTVSPPKIIRIDTSLSIRTAQSEGKGFQGSSITRVVAFEATRGAL